MYFFVALERFNSDAHFAQQRVIGPGGASEAKGPRIRSSARNKGSSDLEERSRQRVFGSGGASATEGSEIWRSVRDEGSSDLEERPRRRALGAGVAWIGKPSGGTVREVSGVLFGAHAKTTASTHLMPPFNFA